MAELIGNVREIESHHADELIRIAEECLRGGDVVDLVSHWFGEVFPQAEPHRRQYGRRRNNNIYNEEHEERIPRWRLRRKEYARMQAIYKKDQSRAAKMAIDGDYVIRSPPLDSMERYWRPLMTVPSLPVVGGENHRANHDLEDVWSPLRVDEVMSNSPSVGTAPGPDGVSGRLWRAVPVQLKTLLFNIILVSGRVPGTLLLSRTIFIPKKNDSMHPQEFRPISITSVAIRHLHRILASRLLQKGLIGETQRSLRDGCAENIAVLATLIEDARRNLKEIHLTTLDVAKAFDSVSHQAVVAALKQKGLPQGFTDYIENCYSNSRTMIEVGGKRSEPFEVLRGVRQGDPLSSILFCMVLDKAIRTIPNEIGYRLETSPINNMAYADDIVLISSTKTGMQRALDLLDGKLEGDGLCFNPLKCTSLSMVPAGKTKKLKVITDPQFVLREVRVKQITPAQEWRYLGVDFRSTGVKRTSRELAPMLENLTKAPLKPQQRLHILKCYLLPRLYHQLILNGTTLGRLRGLDKQVRLAVRRWLRLPADSPISYVHASVRDGGLGVPSMVTTVPGLMLNRMRMLDNSSSEFVRVVSAQHWVSKRTRWAEGALTKEGRLLDTKAERAKWWAKKLYNTIDGLELREAGKSQLSTSWVANPTTFIPGRDVIQYHHVRINCLPTRVRTTRGRPRTEVEIRCRAGCNSTETAAHIIQNCHRTHGGRIKRHDMVTKTVASGLKEAGWRVCIEPRFHTEQGLRKPDIVAVKADSAVLIDSQVISGSSSIGDAHRRKASYYSTNPDIPQAISSRFGVDPRNIRFSSCTLSYKGIWSAESADFLHGLGLPWGTLAGITTRVLQGSSTNWNRWNKITTVRNFGRDGVG